MPSPSIPAEVATAATQGASALETGHSILERAAVAMTATFVGIGGAGFASTERSLLRDPVHEATIQQLTDLPAGSRSELGRYDLLRPSEPRGLAQTVSMGRPADLTLNVVEDEHDTLNVVGDVQQSVLEEISLSLEEDDICYPPSSGVAEEASGTSHRRVDEAEEGDCIGTSFDSDDETTEDETTDGDTLVAPVGDLGNGQIQEGSGTDQVLGGGGDDDLEGEDGRDLIEEEKGDDAIAGKAREHKGLDASLGGGGQDQISGGAGNDEVMGDDVTPTEDDENDTPEAGDGSDLLQGGGGNDGLGAGAKVGDLEDGSDDDMLDGAAVGESMNGG